MHALTDAILGAIGEGDIGMHFPPSDPQWKGAASRIFLEKAVELLDAKGGVSPMPTSPSSRKRRRSRRISRR